MKTYGGVIASAVREDSDMNLTGSNTGLHSDKSAPNHLSYAKPI
jgi:hypothetical protein